MPPTLQSLQFTPGPRHLFARFRNNSLGFYLGTCVTAPKPKATYHSLPVLNDLGGRSVPFQVVQDGENHVVLATLNRFDYGVIDTIRALRNGQAAGVGAAGQEAGVARGTLMLGVSDFELIVVNGYFNSTGAGAGNAPLILPAGRRYYSSNLLADEESTEGTRVLEVALAIACENVYIPSTRGFALYTQSDLGTLAPIT